MQVENICGVIILYLKKCFVGASAIMMILVNNPQVMADEVEIFGGEFENPTTQPEQTQTETPPVENNPATEETPPVADETVPAVEEPVQTQPVADETVPAVEEPVQTQPVADETTPAVEEPFGNNTNNDDEEFGDELIFADPNNQPVEVFTPDNRTQQDNPGNVTVNIPRNNTPASNTNTNTTPTRTKSLKKLPQRFIQVAVDENYIYYLDKQSVAWKKVPYMNSEYMADVWVRMIERNSNTDDLPADMADYINDTNTDEIELAKAKGYQYTPDDTKVLSNKKYFLEHYYLRPQKDQIQFLAELEVVGHPQNTASQRRYDASNWEDLIPGSMESILYYSILQVIGKGKASDKGHMTFADMVEEYGRISIR